MLLLYLWRSIPFGDEAPQALAGSLALGKSSQQRQRPRGIPVVACSPSLDVSQLLEALSAPWFSEARQDGPLKSFVHVCGCVCINHMIVVHLYLEQRQCTVKKPKQESRQGKGGESAEGN